MLLPQWSRQEWPLTHGGGTLNTEVLLGRLLMWDELNQGTESRRVFYRLFHPPWRNRLALLDPEYDPLGFRWPTAEDEDHPVAAGTGAILDRIQSPTEPPTGGYGPVARALVLTYAHEWSYLARIRPRWLRFIQRDPWLNDSRFKRRMSRKGIPHTLRPYCWSVALGSLMVYSRNVGCYSRLLQSKLDESIAVQINLDVPRTYPSHVWFKDPTGGQDSLRRLLYAFAVYNPAVNYCQSLNFLAGVLLLIFPEELAFWSLVQLVDTRLYSRGFSLSDYYSPDMRGLRQDMFVFGELVRLKLPDIYELFDDWNIELLCSHWLLCLYSNRIPMPLSLRIWDSLILEGDKILFRVGLAILRCLAEKFKQSQNENQDGVITVLRGDLNALAEFPIEYIMRIAFKERLKRTEIKQLRLQWKFLDIVPLAEFQQLEDDKEAVAQLKLSLLEQLSTDEGVISALQMQVASLKKQITQQEERDEANQRERQESEECLDKKKDALKLLEQSLRERETQYESRLEKAYAERELILASREQEMAEQEQRLTEERKALVDQKTAMDTQNTEMLKKTRQVVLEELKHRHEELDVATRELEAASQELEKKEGQQTDREEELNRLKVSFESKQSCAEAEMQRRAEELRQFKAELAIEDARLKAEDARLKADGSRMEKTHAVQVQALQEQMAEYARKVMLVSSKEAEVDRRFAVLGIKESAIAKSDFGLQEREKAVAIKEAWVEGEAGRLESRAVELGEAERRVLMGERSVEMRTEVLNDREIMLGDSERVLGDRTRALDSRGRELDGRQAYLEHERARLQSQVHRLEGRMAEAGVALENKSATIAGLTEQLRALESKANTDEALKRLAERERVFENSERVLTARVARLRESLKQTEAEVARLKEQLKEQVRTRPTASTGSPTSRYSPGIKGTPASSPPAPPGLVPGGSPSIAHNDADSELKRLVRAYLTVHKHGKNPNEQALLPVLCALSELGVEETKNVLTGIVPLPRFRK
ncbi:TBC domain protein [Gregarina niphandrodes]|uniref:TBC domain protein n=1 Tax=Gregarina niphandrodes TaxID=110365 RepID=A0A023BCF1_GRENI|nr:TBC domain protein [Gregarina niphandrodes]EZG83736.1 TBC domain protein [Gregarina niphandrodes]|eukprot:XP_011128914.1 TBC domain protein [Gregarina niphandrodes]